jgi:predicted pyridoxine 5'-phosphate oxidase superfamily flavin-nucleotide-binding protein
MQDASSPFHPGERAVQQRVGVADSSADVGDIIAPSISTAVRRSLASQRLAVAASLDPSGQPWASLLTGPPGFLQAADDRLLHVRAIPRIGDPLAANLAARPELALLAIDLATRRRLRLNGRGQPAPDGLWLLADQVYGNCPKYIQKRRLVAGGAGSPAATTRFAALEPRHRALIARSDTFFIASFHPRGGADASHRGGRPGFVRVLDERRIAWPDYPGNNMFNTLGNVVEEPRVGLLFLDFESGDLVQIAGRAAIRFEPERAVEVTVSEVLETRGATPSRWELLEYSPSNP